MLSECFSTLASFFFLKENIKCNNIINHSNGFLLEHLCIQCVLARYHSYFTVEEEVRNGNKISTCPTREPHNENAKI